MCMCVEKIYIIIEDPGIFNKNGKKNRSLLRLYIVHFSSFLFFFLSHHYVIPPYIIFPRSYPPPNTLKSATGGISLCCCGGVGDQFKSRSGKRWIFFI